MLSVGLDLRTRIEVLLVSCSTVSCGYYIRKWFDFFVRRSWTYRGLFWFNGALFLLMEFFLLFLTTVLLRFTLLMGF